MKTNMLFLAFVVLVIILACGSQPDIPSSSSPTQIPFVSPSSTEPPTSLPILTLISIDQQTLIPTAFTTFTNTPLPPLPDFEQVVSFGGGGGAFGYVGYCFEYEISNSVIGPSIFGTSASAATGYTERLGTLCFRDVKPGLPFSVNIVSPDQQMILSANFSAFADILIWEGHTAAEISYWGSVDESGLIDGELHIWWPVGFPFGEWYIYSYGEGLQAQGPFDVPKVDSDLSINRTQEIGAIEPDSFSRIIPIDSQQRHWVKPEINTGVLEVFGAGFSPSELVYILVYQGTNTSFGDSSSEAWVLIEKQATYADSIGILNSDLTGPFANGQTYLVVSVSAADVPLIQGDYKYLNIENENIGYDVFFIGDD